jgi:hypothetical protein
MLIYDRGIKNNKINEEMILRLKELFSLHLKDRVKLGELIDKYLIPHDNERRKNAEVSTPYSLRQEMLDSLEKYGDGNFWKNQHTVFEPCCGKGGFVVDIIDRFMTGLAENIPNAENRYRYIVEHCIYFADINPLNIFITRLLVDPFGKYKLNYFQGDTLKIDIQREFKLKGFDLVVGNPPYQNSSTADTRKGGYGGRSLWDKFVNISLDKWINMYKFLLYVHPPSWRKPEHYLWNIMKSKQISYIKMLSEREGTKLFNCNISVDFYLLSNEPNVNNTVIYGQDKVSYCIDLKNWNFLPSGTINLIEKVLGNQEVIYSRSLYGSDKKWISKTADKEYKYPVVHTMTQKGNSFIWSKENKGHIGIKKVILNFGRHQYPYNDYDGKYGMSQISYGLEIDNKEDGDNICKAINSSKFKEIIKYTKWSTFQTDWRMFKYFKKDFWREFI